MICNNCKKEIPDESLFCEFCGAKIEQNQNQNQNENESKNSENNIKICPNCGTKNNSNNKFCKNCGINFKKNNFGCYLFIGGIIAICILSIFLLSDFITLKPRAKNCEDSEVKDLVIELFKQNDLYYKDIDPSTISSIYIQYPAVTSYDKDIDKYFCDGQLVMESYEGFRPTNYEFFANSYFRQTTNPFDATLTKYTKYVCPLNYSSQISEGKTLVSSSSTLSCNFSCDGDCTPLINFELRKKREEQQKIIKQKRLEEKKQQEQRAKNPKTPEQKELDRYAANTYRKLRLNWDVPKDIGNKPAKLRVKIGKDGSLISYKISQSSGSVSTDESVIEALKRTAPFTPLPESFKGQSVEVLFTFDLNIYHEN